MDKKKRIVYLCGFVAVLLSMWLGMRRMGGGGITIAKLFYNIIVQPTCGDIVYCFNCAADMWHSGNGLFGYTYIDYPLQLLPFSIGNYSPPVLLIHKYGTLGGGLFFTEPMMNFGIGGVIITSVLFCIVMYYMLKKGTQLRTWMWIPIVIEVFRICWYGRPVWIFAVFVEIPIAYLGTKWVLNKM